MQKKGDKYLLKTEFVGNHTYASVACVGGENGPNRAYFFPHMGENEGGWRACLAKGTNK